MKNAISILLSLVLLCGPAAAQWAAVLAGSPPASGAYSPGTDANVVQWLYAPAISGPPADGDPVATWNAGTGANAVQATSGLRPTYQTNEQNSKAVVRFDGTDLMVATYAGDVSQGYTVFWAFKGNTGGGQIYLMDGIDSAKRLGLLYDGTTMQIYCGAGPVDLATVNTSFHVMAIEVNGASTAVRVDNGSWATVGSTAGTNPLSGVTIAARFSETNAGILDLGEFFIRNTINRTTNDSIMDGYMRTTWATW